MASNDPYYDSINKSINSDDEDEFFAEDGWGGCRNKHLHDELLIPINELKKSHFPTEWQTDDFMNDIKVFAQLVVQIKVKGVSKDRPDRYEDNSGRFPHGEDKGNNEKVTIGSGHVYCPLQFQPIEEDCTCLSCVEAKKSRLNQWYFLVATSKHVVYDISEAKKAKVRCFFDEPKDKSEYFLYGVDYYPKRDAGFAKEEVCFVMCVTHDENLVNKLKQVFKERNKIFNGYHTLKIGNRPVILVSHPHGRSKMVTVGRFVHFTVPIGEQFQVNQPIKFATKTVCIVPCKLMSTICWEDFFEAHGIDLCSQATETGDYIPSQHFEADLSKFGGKFLIQHESIDGLRFDVDYSVSIVNGRPKVKFHFLDGSTKNPKLVTPADEHNLFVLFPPNSSFILPDGAEYALRKTSSALLNFPAGTRYRFCDDKSDKEFYPLSTEFTFRLLSPKFVGFVNYETMSCGGSSGGSVIINIQGTYEVLPHAGRLKDDVKICYGRIPYVIPVFDFSDSNAPPLV